MSHIEREEKISQYWKDNLIFEKSISSRPDDKEYNFYDGPPFATGLPHYGHILGLTSKDLFPRFWTMKGYKVNRRWGWDCHGLPIENIAEKELKIKDKKEIETMGVDKFNEFCRSKVLYFAKEWKNTVNRMGKWIEFDNAYKTMDNSYMESVWYLFKQMYDKGYVYQGKKVLMYCPRCQTPLSNSEIAMDNSYKDVTETTLIVKFNVKGDRKTSLLAWTTTPWTLIGNVALAVNPNLDYVKIKMGEENLILVKKALENIKDKYEIIEEFKGSKLVNVEYDPLYDIPSDKKGHYIIEGGDDVTADDGTGIVHMAIYGEFDYNMIRKHDLPVIQHIDGRGKLVLGPTKWNGIWFKKLDKLVIEDLEERYLLFKAEDHMHSYPFCYRCDTPLMYHAVDSWFIDIQKIKAKLIERNDQINWYPSNIKEGRFNHILETAPDWSISRNRFWATSIPIWQCDKCKKIKVIGSTEELKTNAIETLEGEIDLHKHIVDKIHIKCECGNTMNRIPEVFDCWFESGSMPYASKHYPFENKEWFETHFPADFVSEYIAQVRAWFYYMHVISVTLYDKAPFKNVVVSGNVLAEDGVKMSKSKKNFPDPNLIFDKYGADTLRFYLMNSQLMKAQDLNFKEESVKEIYRKVIMILQNVNRFYQMFGNEYKFDSTKTSDATLDKWIMSKTHKLIKKCTENLEQYDTVIYCNNISEYVTDLSVWYVKTSRDRFKSNDETVKGQAVNTLAFCLNTLSKIMAPVTPYISEDIYLGFEGHDKESVHLEDWPTHNQSLINQQVEDDMVKVRNIVSKSLEERENVKVPVRQVLQKVTVKGIKLDVEYGNIIKEQLNVKEIEFSEGDELIIELDTNLTPELIREGMARELVRKLNNQRKKMGLTIKDKIKLNIISDDDQLKLTIEEYAKYINESIQATEMVINQSTSDDMKDVKIKDIIVKVSIEKV